MTATLWLFIFCIFELQGLQIYEIKPPISPLQGGIEIFIRGEFNETIKAQFGVSPNTLIPPKSFTNYNGRLTASFITPPAPAPNSWTSSSAQWVRVTDGQNWSQALSFHWEDPISIRNVTIWELPGSRIRFDVTGTNFRTGLRCSTPQHSPLNAKVFSSSHLICVFPKAKVWNTPQLSLISLGGSMTTYYFEPLPSLSPEFDDATLVFAWSGAVDRVQPDYVAIIDAIPESPTYQQIIAKAELPPNLAVNNEPHHMNLVYNQTVLVAGGLLSVLNRPEELFFWDISNPLQPIFLFAFNPPSSVVDDIFILPQGGFIVSMMGAHDGSSPGGIAEWDDNLNYIGEWPEGPRPADFNPHGMSYRQDLDILVSSDFVQPTSTLIASGEQPKLRNTVRIWHPWSERKISSTVAIPKARGLMDVGLIPGNPQAIAYVTTNNEEDGTIVWAIKTLESTFFQVLNLSNYFQFSPNDFMLHLANSEGTRYFISHSETGLLVMLDTSDPENPVFLDAADYGPKSGLHSLSLSSKENYIMTSGYFLDEDDFGYVHSDGDRTIHIVEIRGNQLIKADFNVDMNVAGGYPMRPHLCRFYNKPLKR